MSAVRVGLSSASVFPENTAAAFDIAARLGFDGIELMVSTDPISQDAEAVHRLIDQYGVPVLAVHAPCLLVTQHVWGSDPWGKLTRARAAADRLGAGVVVVHPPFRWQRDYARGFVAGIERMAGETAVRFAVENMFPLRARGRRLGAYAPGWSVADEDYRDVTLDLSHTAVSGSDPLGLVDALGDRLAHLHVADGSGSARDEHLVPGRGAQPCAAVLNRLGGKGFVGVAVVEVNTRRVADRAQREADLAQSLAFVRTHLLGDKDFHAEAG